MVYEEASPICTTMDGIMFGDMDNDDDDEEEEENVNAADDKIDDMIRVNCKGELELYLLADGIKIKTDKGDYNNPLEWWKAHNDDYPTIVELAMEFLSIPAISAASERVWSRAAQLLTTRGRGLVRRLHLILFCEEEFGGALGALHCVD